MNNKIKKEVIFNDLVIDEIERIYEVNYRNKVIYLVNKDELYENDVLKETVIYLNKFKTYTSTCIFGEDNSMKCNFER